jgi:DNA polymerase
MQYQTGKQAILGLGYQMGAPKFVATCAGYGIRIPLDAREVLVDAGHLELVARVARDSRTPEQRDAALRQLKAELCPEVVTGEEVVRAYREGHPRVRELWRNLEDAAIEATRRGPTAEPVVCGLTRWAVRGRFLHCRLPSGRLLSYAAPRVVTEETRWGPRPKLKFWGVNSYTRKWEEQSTYGGKLTENVVQALCRDLMAEAMKRAEAAGYPTVLSVHDEIVAEVPEGFGSVAEFESLMSEVPTWAAGMPVAAEGWRGRRYKK